MAFNGSGTFVRVHDWTADSAASVNITDTRMDAEDDGFAAGLSNCVTRDGQSPATANLPMGGFIHTGVGDASARTHYLSAGQAQDQDVQWGTVGGTADAITLSLTPSISAYSAGLKVSFIAGAENTAAVTMDVSSLGAKDVLSADGQALVAGQIASGGIIDAVYDGTQFLLAGILSGRRVLAVNAYTAPGESTWTKPAGCHAALVFAFAGGGGGGSANAAAGVYAAGGGGGGGGLTIDYITSGLGATETVTVGDGGLAEAAGENTTFGAHVTAVGGAGGGGATSGFAAGGAGGTASGTGIIGFAGNSGRDGLVAGTTMQGGEGGAGPWGGGTRGSTATGTATFNGADAGSHGAGGGGGLSGDAGGFGTGGAGTVGAAIVISLS